MLSYSSRSALALAAAWVATFSAAPADASFTLLEKDDWKVVMGGFVETDIFSDSTRSFTEVVGSNPVARPGSFDGDNGRGQFSIRNSRFFFRVAPPVENGWKTAGFLEFDFLGYDPSPGPATISESAFSTNPTLRLRHGFLSAEKGGLTLLAGQTWTLFGWAPFYVPTTASVPPVTGAVYERTSQVTALGSFVTGGASTLQAGLSVIRPVQRDSNLPGVDAGVRWSGGSRRAGYSSASGDRKAEPMSVALSGTARGIVTQAAGTTSGTVHHLASAFAIDGMIPVLASPDGKDTSNTLALSGEFTRGRGYGDAFAGWSGNLPQTAAASPAGTPNLDAGQGGFDASGAFHLVELQTWNTQLQYHFPDAIDAFFDLGYGQLRSTNIPSLSPATGKVGYDKSEVYFANLFHDFTSHVRIAFEFDHFRTRYSDGLSAHNNRFQVSSWFRF